MIIPDLRMTATQFTTTTAAAAGGGAGTTATAIPTTNGVGGGGDDGAGIARATNTTTPTTATTTTTVITTNPSMWSIARYFQWAMARARDFHRWAVSYHQRHHHPNRDHHHQQHNNNHNVVSPRVTEDAHFRCPLCRSDVDALTGGWLINSPSATFLGPFVVVFALLCCCVCFT